MKKPLLWICRYTTFEVFNCTDMEISYQLPPTVYSSERITPREFQILTLMSQGHLNKEIATRLNISIETVKKHLKNIYQKTGAHNKIEALNKTKWLTTSLLSTGTNC